MRVLIAVLLVPAAIVTWQWWDDRSTEHTLAPIASSIAGRDVAVDCQTLWGALIDPLPRHGEVRFDSGGVPENRIFLTHETCDRLSAFADASRHGELDCLRTLDWRSRVPLGPETTCYAESSPTVYALLTLAHESYHTAGVANEAVANCYATQAMGYAAAALGAPDEEARLVAGAMASLLPLQRGAYRTSDCVGGGPLDLTPETPAFPTERPIFAPRGRGGTAELVAGS